MRIIVLEFIYNQIAHFSQIPWLNLLSLSLTHSVRWTCLLVVQDVCLRAIFLPKAFCSFTSCGFFCQWWKQKPLKPISFAQKLLYCLVAYITNVQACWLLILNLGLLYLMQLLSWSDCKKLYNPEIRAVLVFDFVQYVHMFSPFSRRVKS